MNKPYANFQKYRINHSFKKKFMKIEQYTRLYMYFPLERIVEILNSRFSVFLKNILRFLLTTVSNFWLWQLLGHVVDMKKYNPEFFESLDNFENPTVP